jgi:hypothetical protein
MSASPPTFLPFPPQLTHPPSPSSLRVPFAIRDRALDPRTHDLPNRRPRNRCQPASFPRNECVPLPLHHLILCTDAFSSRLASTCKHCQVRWKQQQKYLKEAYELYGEVSPLSPSLIFSILTDHPRRQDFHIVKMPLLSSEVRGTDALKKFVLFSLPSLFPPFSYSC